MIELFRSLSWRFQIGLMAGLAAALWMAGGLLRLPAARGVAVASAGAGLALLTWIVLVPWVHDLLGVLAPGSRGAEDPVAPVARSRSVAGRSAAEEGSDRASAGVFERPSAPRTGDGSRGLARFVAQDRAPPEVDDTELRIGIVLSGGGARGVYQAGALLALWDFLEREGAHRYVRAVAATSIGAWNAMFWLTRRVADGALERWWRTAAPARLVEPAHWFPGLRNYLLRDRAWRRSFLPLFGHGLSRVLPGGPPWAYFTRTNVDLARLEVATNRSPSYRYYRVAPSGRGYEPVASVVDPAAGRFRVTSPEEVLEAVFTSMDIPPLFPRARGPLGMAYEDGGVIDNLPIRYTTRYEGCNLLFIFPLHASFESRHSDRSILRRLARVMDVRQGTLERDALRDVSLYNELIALGAPRTRSDIHIKPVTSFVLAPAPEMEIGTFDFWKLRRLGAGALERMRDATAEVLRTFDFDPADRSVRMTVVPPSARERPEVRDFTLR